MRKRVLKRQIEIKRRKNFLPTFIVTLLLWGVTLYIIYFVDPENFGAIPVFFIISFMALLFTFSIIMENTRRGFLIALGIILFIILRYLGVGNLLNLTLIAALVLTAEIYFTKTRG